jgi:hypothetical protein
LAIFGKSNVFRRDRSQEWRKLMRFEVERAREWFARGLPLASQVSRELALDIELFTRGGQEITTTYTGRFQGDTIKGNALNNAIEGGGGNDTVTGGSGNDTLTVNEVNGALPAVQLFGGAGDDIMIQASW